MNGAATITDASTDVPNAGPLADASTDVRNASFFCCNANGDPCCPLGYCADGGPNPNAPAYLLCETDRNSCQGDGGRFEYDLTADGSIELACSPAADAGGNVADAADASTDAASIDGSNGDAHD
jgi:hypothetical protein